MGEVIAGWDQAVAEMNKGERAVLTIPPSLGYGPAEIPGTIPKKATQIFDVELNGWS